MDFHTLAIKIEAAVNKWPKCLDDIVNWFEKPSGWMGRKVDRFLHYGSSAEEVSIQGGQSGSVIKHEVHKPIYRDGLLMLSHD